jgi:putative membrane protein
MNISTTSQDSVSNFKKSFILPIYICLFFCTWIWTLIGAYDIQVWLLENFLLFVLVLTAIFTYKRYQLSQQTYLLLITFLLLHLYGARYTYENNPLGLWIQQWSGSSRNSYDRIVHFAFGLLLTYPIFEIIRNFIKLSFNISAILSFAFISTLAAFYEIIEWVVGGIFFPDQGPAFIGMQGDSWDTQKDIFLAIAGSLLTILVMSVNKKRIVS